MDYGIQDVYEVESISGRTADSTNDVSPAPSMYSFAASRDGRSMYKELAGRILNAQNDVYTLPAGALLLFLQNVRPDVCR